MNNSGTHKKTNKMFSHYPLVSVLMCAYNASSFIRDAIESILVQTYKNYEFIVVDDGSTDNTVEIIKSYHDSRISLIRCKHDYIRSLNVGMSKCKGVYIARIDADDKALPNRIEIQVKTMMKKVNIAACFSWANTFGDYEEHVGFCVKGWLEHPLLLLLSHNFLIHSSAMIRKEFLLIHNLKYKRYPYAEDYKLWMDIARCGGRIYVLPKDLVQYRVSRQQTSCKYYFQQLDTKLRIQQEIIEELIPLLPIGSSKTIKNLFKEMIRLNELEILQGEEVISAIYRILKRILFS